MSARPLPFKVVNCLAQGFAVAGPPEADNDGEDLEMVLWGVSYRQARAMADDLNADPKLQHVAD